MLQESLVAGLAPKKKREAMAGDYYILTLGLPSVLVECGFLSNPEEEALLLDAGYRQRIAQAVFDGIVDWTALPGDRPVALKKLERS